MCSTEVRLAVCGFSKNNRQQRRPSLGLFAFQEVETGHVLLKGLDAEAVAVLAIDSPFLFNRCGCILLFSPVLRGAKASPL